MKTPAINIFLKWLRFSKHFILHLRPTFTSRTQSSFSTEGLLGPWPHLPARGLWGRTWLDRGARAGRQLCLGVGRPGNFPYTVPRLCMFLVSDSDQPLNLRTFIFISDGHYPRTVFCSCCWVLTDTSFPIRHLSFILHTSFLPFHDSFWRVLWPGSFTGRATLLLHIHWVLYSSNNVTHIHASWCQNLDAHLFLPRLAPIFPWFFDGNYSA